MANAVVDNVRSDTALLTQTPKGNKKGVMQGLSSGQDFGTILSQTKNNKQQTSQIKDTKKVQTNPDTQTMTDASEKKDVADNDTKLVETDATKEQEILTQGMGQEETKETEETDMVSMTDSDMVSQEQDMISEEVVEVVSQTVADLLQNVAEILEVSVEELQDLMEEIKMGPLELLSEDAMVKIALAAEGEDSLIGIVMNETIYDNLHDLAEMVDTKLQELMDKTNLTKDELEIVIDQLQQQADEDYGSADEVMLEVTEEVVNKQVTEDETKPVHEISDTDTNEQNEKPAEENTVEIMHTSGTEKHENGHDMEKPGQEQNQETNKETNLFQQNLNEMGQTDVVPKTSTMTTNTGPNTENILRQLADFVKIETGKEMTEMELQLHPASLGTVHVHLSTKGGIVTAHMTTQNEIVKDVIESQVVSLKNNLEEQGVKVEAIEVSVASHQMEKNLEQGKQGKQEQKNSKAEGIRKIRRANINLNAWLDSEETDDMEIDELEAVRIAKEMLEQSGNTMDLLA